MNSETNTFFACDALMLLEHLPSEAVTLAYLDPPWNTGAGLEWNNAKLKELSDDKHYASYLSKIVQQVRRVLTNEGSLFVHWSLKSSLDVRLVMNQAFCDQPKYEITWCKKRLNVASKGPIVDNEFILVYSKTDNFIYNQILRPLTPEEQSSYTMRDERGQYRVAPLVSPFDRLTRQFPWRGYQPPPGKSWNFPFDKLEALAQDNLIHFPLSRGFPGLKRYLNDHPGFEIGTTWEDIPSVVPPPERTEHPTQTPLALMERIILLASNSGDQLLDPFCGSGTTLVAAQTMGRHWWGADSSAESFQITVNRLSTICGLEARKDYAVLTNSEVMEQPIVDAFYRDIIVNTAEIVELQRVTSALIDNILSLKKLMNISDDEEGVETTIKEMERRIVTSLEHFHFAYKA